MNENAPTNKPEEGVDNSYVDMAMGKPSAMDALREVQASGDPAAIVEAQQAADEKYLVNPQPVKPVEGAEDIESMRKSLQNLSAQMNSLSSGSAEFSQIQGQFFEAKAKLEEAIEKPLREKMLTDAAPIAEGVTDRSFDALKKQLTNLKVKPRMGDPDGGFSTGSQAVAYAQAVLESGLDDKKKYELMQDVYAAMVGYNGETAAKIVQDHLKELKTKAEIAQQ